MSGAKSTTQPVDAPADPPTDQPAQPAGGRGRSASDKLADENARLRERIADLEDKLAERGEDPGPRTPREPSFGMSEGERLDLIQHGVTTSPFTGSLRTASGEGVEPGNERARRADARASGREATAAGDR